MSSDNQDLYIAIAARRAASEKVIEEAHKVIEAQRLIIANARKALAALPRPPIQRKKAVDVQSDEPEESWTESPDYIPGHK